MILKLFKGIKWKELKWWLVIYPEIGCKKNLENGWELNPCSHTTLMISRRCSNWFLYVSNQVCLAGCACEN